ncbi:hypothetical protein NKJ59_02625 [Mesorhizobium australicum]|uniref:hypothetical protein n=1 Tax=Mesorhizobium australicum TaxID=536018 RepID=UPI003335B2DF
MLGTDQAAHQYGCRGADTKNARYEADHLGEDLDPSKHPKYYLGFYDLRVSAIEQVAAKLDYYAVALRCVPENGEHAHFELQLEEPTTSPGANKLKKDRQLARNLLSLRLFGPQKHICDGAIWPEELRALDLPELTEMPV